MSIRIFVTGGTFDKEYDELHAMNGKSFAWDQVRKNKELGVFEAR